MCSSSSLPALLRQERVRRLRPGPSNEHGRENTVQPAKAKTTGTVRTVTDKTSDGLTVHDLKNGEIAPVQYGDFKFSTIDGVTADQITDVNGFTVKTNWNPTVENQAYAGTLLGTMYQPNKNGASWSCTMWDSGATPPARNGAQCQDHRERPEPRLSGVLRIAAQVLGVVWQVGQAYLVSSVHGCDRRFPAG